MYEAKFKLRHRGCWTQGLKRFKSEFLTHITVSLTESFVQDIVKVTLSDENERAKIKAYFDKHKLVSNFDVLSESKDKMLLQIFTDTSHIKSIVYTILKNNCFVPNTVPLVDSYEIWTIAAPSRYRLKKAVEDIKQLGNFSLLHIGKSTFDGYNLSPMQERILKTAVSKGYYKWPRKISAQTMSKQLGLNKATVLEHLRKAEIKIVKRNFGI
jgi:predicted DNA binding protein